jgi:hypothetical protein
MMNKLIMIINLTLIFILWIPCMFAVWSNTLLGVIAMTIYWFTWLYGLHLYAGKLATRLIKDYK